MHGLIVSLEAAKAFLRVDHTEDDALIRSQLRVAHEYASSYMRVGLRPREVAETRIYHPPLFLQWWPIRRLIGVETSPESGSRWIPMEFCRLTQSMLTLRHGEMMKGAMITVRYAIGFASVAAVPESIRQGILCHSAYLYNEEDNPSMYAHIHALYAPYKPVTL